MGMSVGVLDHFNIRTRDLASTVRFYEDVLGLEKGPRPNFAFPGAWMYSEGKAVVHIVDISKTDEAQKADSGVVHHVAFASRGFDGMKARHRLLVGCFIRLQFEDAIHADLITAVDALISREHDDEPIGLFQCGRLAQGETVYVAGGGGGVVSSQRRERAREALFGDAADADAVHRQRVAGGACDVGGVGLPGADPDPRPRAGCAQAADCRPGWRRRPG